MSAKIEFFNPALRPNIRQHRKGAMLDSPSKRDQAKCRRQLLLW